MFYKHVQTRMSALLYFLYSYTATSTSLFILKVSKNNTKYFLVKQCNRVFHYKNALYHIRTYKKMAWKVFITPHKKHNYTCKEPKSISFPFSSALSHHSRFRPRSFNRAKSLWLYFFLSEFHPPHTLHSPLEVRPWCACKLILHDRNTIKPFLNEYAGHSLYLSIHYILHTWRVRTRTSWFPFDSNCILYFLVLGGCYYTRTMCFLEMC